MPGTGGRFDTRAALARTGLRRRTADNTGDAPQRQRSGEEVPAPLLRRGAATVVDTAVVGGLIVTPFWMVAHRDDSWWPPSMLVVGVAMLVLVTVLRARTGRSLASGPLGVRTVVGEEGEAPGIAVMVRRHLVFAASSLLFGASLWSTALGGGAGHRGWHDRAAGTRVLDTRWGRDPLERATPGAAERDPGGAGTDGGGVVTDPTTAPLSAPPSGSRPSNPAVLPSGLDMTPRPDPESQARPVVGTSREWIAVTDAAERAAGDVDIAPAPVVVEDSPRRVRATLVDDTGRCVSVVSSVLLGRDPEAAPGEDVDQLMAIEDPTRTVSKTHLRVDVDDTGVSVVDRHSTNGSAVCIGEVEYRLDPGVAMGIPVGAEIRLGDRTVRVEAP